tara:strand:- start:7 stop:174 length:168 start_codon:yes stop_codon:yes gene_type:complete
MIKKPMIIEMKGRKDATKVPPKINTTDTTANTNKKPIVIKMPNIIPRYKREEKDS